MFFFISYLDLIQWGVSDVKNNSGNLILFYLLTYRIGHGADFVTATTAISSIMRGRRRKKSHRRQQPQPPSPTRPSFQAWCHRRRRMGGQGTRFLGRRIGSTRWSNFVRSNAGLVNPLFIQGQESMSQVNKSTWFSVKTCFFLFIRRPYIFGNQLCKLLKSGSIRYGKE